MAAKGGGGKAKGKGKAASDEGEVSSDDEEKEFDDGLDDDLIGDDADRSGHYHIFSSDYLFDNQPISII